jgi:hypothetical protein
MTAIATKIKTATKTKKTELTHKKAKNDQKQKDLEAFIKKQLMDVRYNAREGVHLVRKGDQIVPDKGYLKGLEYPIKAWLNEPEEIRYEINALDARIKYECSIQYHGAIAGRKTNDIVSCNGIDWLVTSSPKFVEPVPGDWTHMKELVETLLPEEQAQLATYSWLKVQVHAIRSGMHSKCPMLILAGDANDGKSFFLRLITVLRGGREINPMKAWNGEGAAWTDHLIGAECLNIDDSGAQKDYRSRENFAAKFKETIYSDSITIDKRHTTSFTLDPRPVLGLVLALNANGNAIKVLPALDGDDMSDKAIVLRTQHAKILWREQGDEAAAQRMKTYLDELPAFMNWLLHEFKVPSKLPKGCETTRSGAVLYRNPEAMSLLHSVSPAGLLEEALDEHIESYGLQYVPDPMTSQSLLTTLGDWRDKDTRIPRTAQMLGIYLAQIAARPNSCVEVAGQRDNSKLWKLKKRQP